MKHFPCGSKIGYVSKAKKCCSDHPVVTAIIIALIAAAITFAIVAIVKMAKKEEDLLDEEWDLDDEENEVYFYPSEEDFVEGE